MPLRLIFLEERITKIHGDTRNDGLVNLGPLLFVLAHNSQLMNIPFQPFLFCPIIFMRF
jgi:hypothetical protein